MSQRTMLIIAAALTAFVLVLVGGVAARLSQPADSQAATSAPAVPADAEITLDPTAQALLAEREAAYQQALAEANRRIDQANAQLAQANAQLAQAPAVAAPASSAAAPGYAIAAEQAQQIALGAAPGAALRKPAELVLYQDRPAYEVALDRGLVYVDAQSGAILANGAVAPATQGAVSPEQAAQIAVAYRGGGEVREVERERERGASVYEVKFSDGGEVYVDAATGQVVYARIGGDHERAGEGHDDD